ncbi:hypothetical protein [Nocardia sp. NPDC019255]|uniref:hypothetical protein n=1 Tax=Nocardia sp. NPDC019255 TaxID=3154591 RepID=UPI0034009372
MDLTAIEQLIGDSVEQVGDMLGEHLLQTPHWGAEVREVMAPTIRDAALAFAEFVKTTAVMADANQPIAVEP